MENMNIERINELARKAKEIGLTDKEMEERNILRKEYLEKFREGMKKNIIDNMYIVDENGNKNRVQKKY